jgi:hypothetical protein
VEAQKRFKPERGDPGFHGGDAHTAIVGGRGAR